MSSVRLTRELKTEYQRLFDSCLIRDGKMQEIESILAAIQSNESRYRAVGEPLAIPWYFIAVVHNMESTRSFTKHLHNGDPLTARTVNVPAGHPRSGDPPFTWEESAADALQLKNLHNWTDWSCPCLLYKLEEYNGWGYRLYHPHVLSPYLWSGSTHYTSGKYVADGRWSDNAVSGQIGAAVLLRRMAEQGTIQFPRSSVGVQPAQPAPAGPLLRHSNTEQLPYARELQNFLNTLPGIYVKVDGIPGDKTSEALRKATGHYLPGDPRVAD